jgi:uncharacterized membrane protein (DUF373 family)
MQMRKELVAARKRWAPLNFYQRFEDVVVFILTALMAVVIVLALWNLALKIVFGGILTDRLDPTDYAVFQTLFGMFFTVIIALEFKKSLLVLAERRDSIVQVRTVVLIALLAALRKLIILEPAATDALHLFGLAAVILALGAVFWLVRDQDERRVRRREQPRD